MGLRGLGDSREGLPTLGPFRPFSPFFYGDSKGMSMSENDLRVLDALAKARAQHEELADLLDFYDAIYRVQFRAKANLAKPPLRDDLAMRWRLEGGVPQLTFDQLDVEPQTFKQLVQQVATVLLHHNPTWEIDWEQWTAEALVAKAREVFETWGTLTAPKVESGEEGDASARQVHPIALAVGFALAPYLQRASETVLPLLDLKLWPRGYCPVCGGQPHLALLEQERGARQLMCSRCTSLWEYSRIGCPLCKSREKQKYYKSEDGLYRLYVCPDCNRYIKTVDLREAQREIQPMVERLITVGMDLAAQQAGFLG
jgi:formate dehydrogenase accessory protein FdhE